jgi:hypothetical protein
LRLASLEFGAASVESVLILLDHDTCLAAHAFSLSPHRPGLLTMKHYPGPPHVIQQLLSRYVRVARHPTAVSEMS